MFGKKKAPKLDKQTLLFAADSAMESWMDASGTDQLLLETGKSRQELLDAVLADDEVESCREDIRTAILAEPWRIWGEDAPEEAINRLYKNIRRLANDFAELAILARFGGYAVAEYVFKQEPDGFLSLDQVLSKDGELDSYTPKRDGSVSVDKDGEQVEINQHVKYLVLKSKAVPARPAGELMIIRAYPAVALRKRDWVFAGQFIARYTQPYIVGKQSGFANVETFTSKLFGLMNGGAAGISKEDDIQFHELKGNGDAFERLEQMCNRRIQKLLLGRVKTSELSSGSRAAQETDDASRQDRVSAYLDLMSNAIQHALDAILAVNQYYGLPIHAPQGLWFEYQQQFPVDTKRAERDAQYCSTGQVRLTKSYYMDILGFEEKHIEMVPPANVPSPMQTLSLSSGAGLALSSADSAEEQDVFDVTEQADLAHLQPKIDALFAALDESDSFAEFEQKLAELELPDEALIQDLITQCAKSFADGASGDKPIWAQS